MAIKPDVPDKAWVGRQIAGVNARLDAAERQASVDTIVTVGIPVIDNTYTPTFTIGKKGRIFVNLKFAAYGNADDLRLAMVKESDILTAADFDSERLTAHLADPKIDDNARTAQSVVARVDQELESQAPYRVIKLTAIAKGQDGATNPNDVTGPPTYAGYLLGEGLATFTTPPPFNPPLGAREVLIREAGLDQNTKAEDAYDVLRIFGPKADDGTGLSLRSAKVDALQPLVTELDIQTTLVGGINNSVTSMAVGSATGLVAGRYCYMDGEIVLLGTPTGTTFPITRGQLFTTPASHSNGVFVWQFTNVDHNEKIRFATDAELDQVATDPDGVTGRGYVDAKIAGLFPGTPCVWIGNQAHSAGEKAKSTGTAIFFYAGDIARAQPGIPELTATSIQVDETPPNDGLKPALALLYTQPTPSGSRPSATPLTNLPVCLRRVLLLRDGVRIANGIMDDDEWQQPGPHVFPLRHLTTKKLTQSLIAAQINAFGPAIRTITNLYTTGDSTEFSDLSTANWIFGLGTATAVQAGLNVISNSGVLRIKWAAPTHQTVAPDSAPRTVLEYGVVIQAGDGSANYFDHDNPTVASSTEIETLVGKRTLFNVTHKRSTLPAIFQTQGFRFRIRPYNRVLGVLTPGPYSAFSTATTLLGEPVVVDTALAPTPVIPTVQGHPRKIKVICPVPVSNFNQFVKNEIAARVKNGGGTIIGYIVDGTAIGNSASEFFNDRERDLIHSFFWSKDAVIALYPTGITIEFYNRITNGFGVTPSGTPRVFTISTWSADLQGAVTVDTEVPGGTGATLLAPVCSFEDGKLTLDFDVVGLSNMNTHLYNMFRIATLSETVATFTITNAPNTASPTTITTSAPHGYSVGQTIVISSVVGNTAVNGTWTILTVPSTTTFRIPVAGSGAYVSGGTVSLPGAFLDIASKTLTANSISSKKQIHKAGHTIVSVRRRKLRELFGPTAHIAVRVYIVNSIGETQSAIADVNLGTMVDVLSETGLEASATIPAKTMALNTTNVCPGGDFTKSKDAFDFAGSPVSPNVLGREWRDLPNRSTGVRISTTGSRGLTWIKANHEVEAATNVFSLGGELSCFVPIRPFLPGDTWSQGISMRMASGIYVLNNFTASLYDEGNAADIPGTAITALALDPSPIILNSTVFTVVGCVFVVGTSYVPGTSPRRQWVRLKFGENPPAVIRMTNEITNRGAQILPWGPALEDASVQADTDPSGDTGSGAAGGGGGGQNGGGGGTGGSGGGVPPGGIGAIPY